MSENIIQTIGFLQEDFHSEVLDFLLELCSTIYPNVEMILYNDVDRYNNKELLLKRYTNLVVKNLSYFIPELTNNELFKIFVISYDNIIHLNMMTKYKDNLVFIAHSPKHIKSYNSVNMNYFSLTPLLSEKYMLPITNQDCRQSTYDSEIQNYLTLLKNIREEKNLTFIITIGYFLENNKNIKLIENLLQKEKFILVVFAPEISNELNTLIGKYPKYVFTALGLKTKDIRYTINYLDINYLLFCPPKDSNYTKNSWSGTLAFGLENNLHTIVSEKIIEIYNLTNDHILPYKNDLTDDENATEIANLILNNKNSFKESLSSWKTNNFNRNKEIFKNLLFNKKDDNKNEKININTNKSLSIDLSSFT